MCGATGGASGRVHFNTGEAIDSTRMPRASTVARTRVDLGVGMVDDVLAVDDPQLGERHAEIGHRAKRAIEVVGRELVGDRTDLENGVCHLVHRPLLYLIGAGSRRGESRCTISSATRYADAAMMNTGR